MSQNEASSLDGRTFTYRANRASAFLAGQLVVLAATSGEQFLGQVREQFADTGRGTAFVEGEGSLVALLDRDGVPTRRRGAAFLSATIEPVTAALVDALEQQAGATLPIGVSHSGGGAIMAHLRAQGFNRHTFLCGQSGSGKTYALGVILEQLILGTDLRMVVLDPNADFVRLDTARQDAPAEAVTQLAGESIRVLRASAAEGEPLRMRFASMPRQAQAAVLQIDPLEDRDEYNRFLHLVDTAASTDINSLLQRLRDGDSGERALGQRIENLGLVDWEIWARDLPSAAEIVSAESRVTVLDLSGFRDPLEPLAVSLELIERLWADRETRTPTLIVIDEAHNLCPAEPTGPIQKAVTKRLIQIAAEGRKYGLWLLLSTQRPAKLHPQVLSQCDNLALMRMNSPADVSDLGKIFGFVPPAMMTAAHSFSQGEMLIAGAITPAPWFIQVGERLTEEGGSDVPVPLR